MEPPNNSLGSSPATVTLNTSNSSSPQPSLSEEAREFIFSVIAEISNSNNQTLNRLRDKAIQNDFPDKISMFFQSQLANSVPESKKVIAAVQCLVKLDMQNGFVPQEICTDLFNWAVRKGHDQVVNFCLNNRINLVELIKTEKIPFLWLYQKGSRFLKQVIDEKGQIDSEIDSLLKALFKIEKLGEISQEWPWEVDRKVSPLSFSDRNFANTFPEHFIIRIHPKYKKFTLGYRIPRGGNTIVEFEDEIEQLLETFRLAKTSWLISTYWDASLNGLKKKMPEKIFELPPPPVDVKPKDLIDLCEKFVKELKIQLKESFQSNLNEYVEWLEDQDDTTIAKCQGLHIIAILKDMKNFEEVFDNIKLLMFTGGKLCPTGGKVTATRICYQILTGSLTDAIAEESLETLLVLWSKEVAKLTIEKLVATHHEAVHCYNYAMSLLRKLGAELPIAFGGIDDDVYLYLGKNWWTGASGFDEDFWPKYQDELINFVADQSTILLRQVLIRQEQIIETLQSYAEKHLLSPEQQSFLEYQNETHKLQKGILNSELSNITHEIENLKKNLSDENRRFLKELDYLAEQRDILLGQLQNAKVPVIILHLKKSLESLQSKCDDIVEKIDNRNLRDLMDLQRTKREICRKLNENDLQFHNSKYELLSQIIDEYKLIVFENPEARTDPSLTRLGAIILLHHFDLIEITEDGQLKGIELDGMSRFVSLFIQ